MPHLPFYGNFDTEMDFGNFCQYLVCGARRQWQQIWVFGACFQLILVLLFCRWRFQGCHLFSTCGLSLTVSFLLRRLCFLWPSQFNPDVLVPPYHFRYWSVRIAARNPVEPSRFEHKHCHWASRRVSSFPQGEGLATESNCPWCSHCRHGDASLGLSPFLSNWRQVMLSGELVLYNPMKCVLSMFS